MLYIGVQSKISQIHTFIFSRLCHTKDKSSIFVVQFDVSYDIYLKILLLLVCLLFDKVQIWQIYIVLVFKKEDQMLSLIVSST